MSETYADLGGGISGVSAAPDIRVAQTDAAAGHRHQFDGASGWCGCGARDDGQLAEGSPAWRAHRAAATSAADG